MIGKIVTGKSFGGAVEYVLKKEKTRLLDSDGVDTESIRATVSYTHLTLPTILRV